MSFNDNRITLGYIGVMILREKSKCSERNMSKCKTNSLTDCTEIEECLQGDKLATSLSQALENLVFFTQQLSFRIWDKSD